MPPHFRALAWATASLAVALANIFDLIPAAPAQALIITIPVLMVATGGFVPCAPFRRSA